MLAKAGSAWALRLVESTCFALHSFESRPVQEQGGARPAYLTAALGLRASSVVPEVAHQGLMFLLHQALLLTNALGTRRRWKRVGVGRVKSTQRAAAVRVRVARRNDEKIKTRKIRGPSSSTRLLSGDRRGVRVKLGMVDTNYGVICRNELTWVLSQHATSWLVPFYTSVPICLF